MSLLKRYRELWLFAIIVVMIGLVTLRFPGFASPGNLGRIVNDNSILVILALGQMAVIVTRSIDLSMAANLALTGMVAAMLNHAYPGIPVEALIVGCAVLGALLGAFNGVLIWKLGIPPIVVTLGTLTIFRGTIFVIAGGQWVNADEMSTAFIQFQRGLFLGIPILTWFAIVIAALFYLLMTRTPFGRAVYAIGVNPVAAVYAGINVGQTKFLTFVLSGLLAGISGYLWISKYVIASVEVANGYELNIVAACVIGGVALGALFLGVINNALPVINVSPFWQMAISGAAIILAVAFNARSERRRGRIILKKAEDAQ